MPAEVAFSTWLATFYGRVAGLVMNEERNVATIFGQERVPDILCHMLQSCVRLVSSSGTANKKGTLEEALVKADTQDLFLEGYGVTEEFARRVVNMVTLTLTLTRTRTRTRTLTLTLTLTRYPLRAPMCYNNR